MRWSVFDGFTVAPVPREPSTLDDSLVDSAALSTCAGRRVRLAEMMGKITGMVTSATRRLVKEVQLPHCVGRRGSKGPAKLQVDNYGHHGSHARYNSWVILTPATGD